MRRWALIALAILALGLAGAAAFYWRGPDIAVGMMRRIAERSMASNQVDALPDGLHAAVCGSGSPMPDRSRGGPCLAVIAGQRLFVFDAGRGAGGALSLMGLPPGRLEAVFLTHLHSDHLDGLGELGLLRWTGSAATAPLPLYGPSGVERVAAGFNEAYAIDSGYRVAHHGAQVVPPGGFGYSARPVGPGVVLESGGVTITAVAVDHAPVAPAFGYRIDYAGRSIVISGDTAKSAALAQAAKGADLLVHEALSPRLVGELENAARAAGNANLAKIFADIRDYHASPEEAARTAAEAGVGALVLTHIVPPLPLAPLERAFLGDARAHFGGPLRLAKDGDLFSLPADGGAMSRKNLLQRTGRR